jgi:uncharacterized protein YjbI with pentapeptide repeats
VKIKKPQIPALTDDGATTQLVEGSRHERVAIGGADFAGNFAQRVTFDQVRLHKVKITGADLSASTFLDARLESCELSNAVFHEGEFRRVELYECGATGLAAGDATFSNVLFESCLLRLANFRLSKFDSVIFLKCDLRGADFMGAQLTNVAFQDCELGEASFERCVCVNVDLRTSQIEALAGAHGLSGAIIDSLQLLDLAPKLASALGLLVRDENPLC